MAQETRPLHILALACFNTGDRFIERAKERGAKVWLLTKETYLRKKRWRRDLLEDVFAEADNAPLANTINTVSYLARTIRFSGGEQSCDGAFAGAAPAADVSA